MLKVLCYGLSHFSFALDIYVGEEGLYLPALKERSSKAGYLPCGVTAARKARMVGVDRKNCSHLLR